MVDFRMRKSTLEDQNRHMFEKTLLDTRLKILYHFKPTPHV
jgi:hypothetical protein